MSGVVARRPGLTTAAAVGLGVAITYAGYRYYHTHSPARVAYAESRPSDSPAAAKKVSFGGFTELKLESAEMVNHNVKKLRFALPDEDSLADLAPVTSLLSQQWPKAGFLPVIRPYTPISSNFEPGHVTFLVKKYPHGKSSGNLHSLVPGDTVKFKALHELDYTPNRHAEILAVAGGSGITPIYQLTRAILHNPADRTNVTLVYANNSERDILLKAELDQLERQYPGRFKTLFAVSRSAPADADADADADAARYETGYVTKEMIAKVWPARTPGQRVLVSGPPAMTESVAGAKGLRGWTQGRVGGILQELGYGSDEVHKF